MIRGRLPRQQRDKRKLRLWLMVFFLALTVPAGVLIHRAYSQLKFESFHRHRAMAEEFAQRIDRKFFDLIDAEEARSFGDYAFLVVAGDPAASFVQRSQLSAYPVESGVPGLIGYFQVDSAGVFSTPLLPQQGTPRDYGIMDEELARRRDLQQTILTILHENHLVQAEKIATGNIAQSKPDSLQEQVPADRERTAYKAGQERFQSSEQERDELKTDGSVAVQQAFDQLSERRVDQGRAKKKAATLGRVEDLKLEPAYQMGADHAAAEEPESKRTQAGDVRAARKERSAMLEQNSSAVMAPGAASLSKIAEIRISMFESEIDAFEFSVLDSGHFVLFRKVWRDGQRYIQGALIEAGSFFAEAVAADFRRTGLSTASDLAVAYRGDVLSAFSGQTSRPYLSSTDEFKGSLLYKTKLSAPLGDVALIFSITRLPAGPGHAVIIWTAVVLLAVLCAGLILLYRLGATQIDLTCQQQDFVSAVSHELKTPLTSIRMYGEILREGWASEEKKVSYYNYIFDESERLSRLIANVLQLARMNRNDLNIELKPVAVAELMDSVASKISSQIESAGFELNLDCDPQAGPAIVSVDADGFCQIIINLVDNAIKFSAKAELKRVDIGCRLSPNNTARFQVRDYGPGVARDQMKKIFTLFYRSENELTRDTVGTGIGLALVNQLTLAMNGRVDVVNREPGAEFRVEFPAGTIDLNSD